MSIVAIEETMRLILLGFLMFCYFSLDGSVSNYLIPGPNNSSTFRFHLVFSVIIDESLIVCEMQSCIITERSKKYKVYVNSTEI